MYPGFHRIRGRCTTEEYVFAAPERLRTNDAASLGLKIDASSRPDD